MPLRIWPDPSIVRDRQKIIAIVAFAAPIVWQLYAVVLALRHATLFKSLFAGLGGPLPLVTNAFFLAYPYWGLVPILFVVTSWDVLRRRNPPLPYFSSVLVASYAAALLLHAWLQEAFFAPLFSILQKIG
ncbi:MAG: hypothetical protein WAM82_32390 [Thermoanaerobaculia bacterium]